METLRKIKKVWKSKPTIEGAGVHLKRAFGYYQVPMFDPFLLLDDFHSNYPPHYLKGFPWHPHRGIETITYVLQGLVAHGDSMGNKGVIGAGDVQWMTAGSGIIHQEMPQQSPTGMMWGFQFWANLPAARKMMAPRYREVKAADIPSADLGAGASAQVVAGELAGVRGPVRDIVIDPEFYDVSLPASGVFAHQVKPGRTVFAYVLEGDGRFDSGQDAFSHEGFGAGWSDLSRDCLCGPESLVLYEREGDRVEITAGKKPLRFLLVSGRPLGEPVAWRGPIVMNTQAELRTAFAEFEAGTFIKKQ